MFRSLDSLPPVMVWTGFFGVAFLTASALNAINPHPPVNTNGKLLMQFNDTSTLPDCKTAMTKTVTAQNGKNYTITCAP